MTRAGVLYLTRNGLLEPLGQSQVLAYLRGLSRTYDITVITFEKSADMSNTDLVRRVRDECSAYGIRWLPQHFRTGPRVVAPLQDMATFLRLARREVREANIRLIHARSYIPAVIAMLTGRVAGVPFIFDMRALWPEELITAGRLRRGSLLHRAIVMAERACLRRAGAVVSLTHAAVNYLERQYPEALREQQVIVIPTCADLDRFAPNGNQGGPMPTNAPVFGCIGTVLSGWFRVDWLAAFFKTVARRNSEARFEIITRDSAEAVRTALANHGFVSDRLTVQALDPLEMPAAVRRHTASAMFYRGGEISELGRSPTRLAEVLGCGVPALVNPGVGDTEKIVLEGRVGISVEQGDEEAMETAFDALARLQADNEVSARCRRVAEITFSLEVGTRAYADIYARLLHPTASDAV